MGKKGKKVPAFLRKLYEILNVNTKYNNIKTGYEQSRYNSMEFIWNIFYN